VDAIQTDQLWPRVATRIGSARGWSLRPLAPLGQPRATRRTWLAKALDSQDGPRGGRQDQRQPFRRRTSRRSSAGERPAQEWHRELAQLRERRDRRLAERVA
jgi:hypothetical protein